MTGFLVALAIAASASAAVNVSRFTMTPSTTQAGGHPDLDVAMTFDPATADVKDIALHLPPGLTANARAAPFCSRANLVADLCPLATKVGSVALVGEALGIEAEVARNIHNVRPTGAERLRLGVPLFGSVSRGGVALTLPVTARPDGGLDIAVAGPPREVAGYAVRLRELRFRLRGVVRRRIRGKQRRRFLLTNPSSCRPASTVLEVSAHEGPPALLRMVSTFTPSGCK